MTRVALADLASARLDAQELAKNFSDVAPPLDRQRALIEANRCYYCYDAPCIQACPTGIEIPRFIQRIASDDLRGSATAILSANIFGGMCARVCPTEILCEGECVRNSDEDKPVEIGALQRYATDWVIRDGVQLFERAAASGRRVAVVGAGPAGLAAAHGLARAGHEVVVFEAEAKPGGLNEYGIAAYKVLDFAAREIAWLLAIGGIELRCQQVLGRDFSLASLQREFDAVFLGMGLGGVNALALADDASGDPDGLVNAVDFIKGLRQSADKRQVRVGRRVVVIGGGNTAIDAAVQSKKLGAESVTLVYRRGAEAMGATPAEQAFARDQGVVIVHWASPQRVLVADGHLAAIEFEYQALDAAGKLVGKGETLRLDADMVLKAVGQVLRAEPLAAAPAPALARGRIAVDAEFRTSVPGVWAGGDCVGVKLDLTVQAVEDGKRAAQSIDRALRAKAQA
ncbi:MAG: NAD(P)-dependent oxidoreductase [Lysobacterales bacterium]